MIQRIQSIFLIMASIFMAGLFLPRMVLATVSGDTTSMAEAQQSMMSDGIFEIYDHIVILILVVIGIAIGLISLFSFKNRERQLMLNRIGIAVALLMVLLSAAFFYQDYQLMDNGQYVIDVEYGVLLPIIYIILLLLASRSIKKDHNLVRSMDRLR